jgi:M6 family metalloprotease-like protein
MGSQWTAGTSQVPSYSLTIQSEPIVGVEFHIRGNVYHTPWSLTLESDNYTIQMPSNWVDQGRPFHFVSWKDGPNNPTRIVNLQGNLTLTAQYELTYHKLTVNTDPEGILFSVGDSNQTSPWSGMLPEGVYLIGMPPTSIVGGWIYYFSNWEDSSTNPLRTLDLTKDSEIYATYRLRQVVDVTGLQSIHVILVDFLDIGHSMTKDSIQTELSAVQSYFLHTSYGQLSIRFDFLSTWLTLGKTMSYYGAGNFSNERHSDLVNDSLQAASSYADLAVSKRVLIVHAGGDQSDFPHNQNDIWSFAISPTIYSVSGKNVRLFAAVVSEHDPVGTYAHEIGHTLGLPDLYNVTINTTGEQDNFVGPWELMSQGEWNPNWTGNGPSHLSSWSMMYLGWMPPYQVTYVDLNEERTVVIDPIEEASSGLHTIVIPFGQQMFYLVEARSDPDLPQQGVLVYRVDNASISPRILVEDANASTSTFWDAAFQFAPDRVSAFVEPSLDLAIIVLDNSSNQYRLLIGPASKGNEAMAAAKSIYSLIDAIQNSEEATGLKFRHATDELRNASMSYNFADFGHARLAAEKGFIILQSELKSDSESQILGAESELNDTSARAILWGLISPDIGKPRTILSNAAQSYDQGKYILAIQLVTKQFEPAIEEARSRYVERLRQIATYETLGIIIALMAFMIILIKRRYGSN